jgi:hypothetical protein
MNWAEFIGNFIGLVISFGFLFLIARLLWRLGSKK